MPTANAGGFSRLTRDERLPVLTGAVDALIINGLASAFGNRQPKLKITNQKSQIPMAIPEFLLRKLYVRNSFEITENGFSFQLRNSMAPVTVTALDLTVDGKPVPAGQISLQVGEEAARPAGDFSTGGVMGMPVGELVTFSVQGVIPKKGVLAFQVATREAGSLAFSITVPVKGRDRQRVKSPAAQGYRLNLLSQPYPAELLIDAGAVIGEIQPYVYGHFIEHLERSIYGGIWTEDGASLRQDTVELVKRLRPRVIRYPGGNFASGYHWEDGIGSPQNRPRRFDPAWQAWESNRVGTDEFIQFCRTVGADPFLVVNDGSGTPEEAARWVEYCNNPPQKGQGMRRAASGASEPHQVKLWGVGNEVWGDWQIGHTDATNYAARLQSFARSMRQVDPEIRLVGAGQAVISDDPADPGRRWNETVLIHAGNQLDYLSFHIYSPGSDGWQEAYDLDTLHHTLCAAPVGVEEMVRRIGEQVQEFTSDPRLQTDGAVPGDRSIGIALDEWNVWLPPAEGARSIHQQRYTLRDTLYAAGMLNMFQRQCKTLKLANLAQMINVLPLIETDAQRAAATTLYYPFLLYQAMEPVSLLAVATCPSYASESLGNIQAQRGVPYLDVAATRDWLNRRLVISLVNRHPYRKASLITVLRGFDRLKPCRGWQLANGNPNTANTLDTPNRVKPKQVPAPSRRGDRFNIELPPSSVTLLTLEM
jgi:alpha-N-arabinofuranosidase